MVKDIKVHDQYVLIQADEDTATILRTIMKDFVKPDSLSKGSKTSVYLKRSNSEKRNG